MSIEREYAIKSDVRNNPVVREADARHGRDLRRILILGGITVAMLLFSVWQRSNLELTGYRIEDLRTQRQYETSVNRQLRLNVDTLRSPQIIERRATQLGMRHATLADTVVVERAYASSPSGALVARAR